MTQPSEWPVSKVGWHELYRRLDKQFGTTKDSPLHHDKVCPVCVKRIAG